MKRPFLKQAALAAAIRQKTGADAVSGAAESGPHALTMNSDRPDGTLDRFHRMGDLAVPKAPGGHRQ